MIYINHFPSLPTRREVLYAIELLVSEASEISHTKVESFAYIFVERLLLTYMIPLPNKLETSDLLRLLIILWITDSKSHTYNEKDEAIIKQARDLILVRK